MRLIVLPCDGIGPEITKAAIEVLDAADKRFEIGFTYDYEDSGFVSLEKHGTTLRQEAVGGGYLTAIARIGARHVDTKGRHPE